VGGGVMPLGLDLGRTAAAAGLATPPGQGAVVGHPPDEGDRPAVAPEGRRRLPHGDHQFLQQVVLVGRLGEGAADAVEHAEVLAHPRLEPVVSLGHRPASAPFVRLEHG